MKIKGGHRGGSVLGFVVWHQVLLQCIVLVYNKPMDIKSKEA